MVLIIFAFSLQTIIIICLMQSVGGIEVSYLARTANLPEGLYIFCFILLNLMRNDRDLAQSEECRFYQKFDDG